MIGRAAAAAVAAGLVLAGGSLAGGPRGDAATGPAAPAVFSAAEHRYRVIGKVRLAVFWSRGSTVGSARMTARPGADGSELTFLLGSDPALAPRRVNQWSYLREETHRGHASAFELRRLTDDDLSERGLTAAADAQIFGASCEFVQATGIRSLLTTVDGAGVTYRMFERLLDHLARAPAWEQRQLPVSSNVTAGLLSAMDLVIRRTAAQPAALRQMTAVPYVYDGTLYDLSVRGAQSAGPMQFGDRRFEWLTRVDFAVLNRRTREVTRFAAVFAPGTTTPLPVQIIFQPTFWLRVELCLDDHADVPVDPAADAAMLARIRAVCSGAAERAAQTATGGRESSAPRN